MSRDRPLDLTPGSPASGGGAPPVVRDPRFSSAQRGWALMLAAGLLAAFANLAVLRAGDPQAQVLAVAGDHPAGTPVAELATMPRELAIEDPLAVRLVTPDLLAEMDARVTAVALQDGVLLRLDDLQSPTADGRSAMSLPVPAGRAVAGGVAGGDLVDVVADLGAGVEVVARELEVLDVDRADVSLGGADVVLVTVAVDDRDVLPLAAALRADAVDLVRRGTGATARRELADG